VRKQDTLGYKGYDGKEAKEQWKETRHNDKKVHLKSCFNAEKQAYME
jgi:hypothetical protein